MNRGAAKRVPGFSGSEDASHESLDSSSNVTPGETFFFPAHFPLCLVVRAISTGSILEQLVLVYSTAIWLSCEVTI